MKEVRLITVYVIPASTFSILLSLKPFLLLVQQIAEFWPATPGRVLCMIWIWKSMKDVNGDPKERRRGNKNKSFKGWMLESEWFHEVGPRASMA